MVEEKNNTSQTKKTLGIKKKLGIKLDSLKNTQPTSKLNSNKVVVVTKGKSARPRPEEGSSLSKDLGDLTVKEREARLKALKFAEEKQRQDLEKQNLEKLGKEKATTPKPSEISEQAKDKKNGKQEEKKSAAEEHISVKSEAPKKEEKAPVDPGRHEYLRELASKKKRVRNLDNITTPAQPEEEPATSKASETPSPSLKYVESKKKERKPETSEEKESKTPKKSALERRRDSKKLSVTKVMMMDPEEAEQTARYSASKKMKNKKSKNAAPTVTEKVYREVSIPDVITVGELANRMSEKAAVVIKELMKLGVMATVNQSIDADTAEIVVSELGHKVKRVTNSAIEQELIGDMGESDNPEELSPRAPVVTVMGHVDHGKTSLLDALRSTDVVSGESGGITQHIGAYSVALPSGKSITFLDTPGHEAFTAMRMRGAEVTDIVILVVAADDGIMDQTIEAINHAKAAEVPIIVAINKIDKPGADVNRVKNELLNHSLIPEEMGGDTIMVEVSAKQRTNLDKLEEAILLQSEFLDLKANPERSATGAVIESQVASGKGITATLIVQNGTLKLGNIVVAGTAYGKIKAIRNDKGESITEAGPSYPVEILGLNDTATAGDTFIVANDEKKAKELADFRANQEREKKIMVSKKQDLENLFMQAGEGATKELGIVIKADVQGSLEAIVNSLERLSTDEAKVKVLHSGVGAITESDITLARASNAMIIGFNVRANTLARESARQHHINISYYSIIYQLIDDVKNALSGLLSPEIKEEFLGYAEVRKVMNLTKVGKVAGCYVTSGKIKKGSQARLLRDEVVVYEGKLKTLKRFKDDVKEVNSGFECGISFENYSDIKEGDVIESFDVIEQTRKL